MTQQLKEQKCEPCSGETAPLKGPDLAEYLGKLEDDWKVVDDHHLVGEFSFENFREALEFTKKVGELAEEEQHHPDICLSWGKVEIKLWTHAIDGLSENDFILAAKVDDLT